MSADAGAAQLAIEDPLSPEVQVLIAKLSAELGPLYGDDGRGGVRTGRRSGSARGVRRRPDRWPASWMWGIAPVWRGRERVSGRD